MLEVMGSMYSSVLNFAVTSVILIIAIHFLRSVFSFLFPGSERKHGYILVTGCDTGFGCMTASQLSKKGIYTFAACLTQEAVDRFNKDTEFRGKAFLMDVTKQVDIDNARKLIEDDVKEEGLWCLINNAGIYRPTPIDWVTDSYTKLMMDVNTWGTVNVTKAMLPLVKRSQGRIINTASMAGRVASPSLSVYCMSKFCIEAFSDCLRLEMKAWKVSVHIVEPGAHATGLIAAGLRQAWKDLWEKQPKEVRDEYGENWHLGAGTKMEQFLSVANSDPQNVVNAYMHAALSSRPKLRYIVGVDAYILIAISMLPTAVGDSIFQLLDRDPLIPAGVKKLDSDTQ